MKYFAYVIVSNSVFIFVYGKGLLLLYRPKDVTYNCAMSTNLRFDISYGMGMSDTITLVLRTETENDYRCMIEVVTEKYAYLVFVIHYPNTLHLNCEYNPNAFVLYNNGECKYVCQDVKYIQPFSKYYIMDIKNKVKFIFTSNSSINFDMKVGHYQVTITAARKLPNNDSICYPRNETICGINDSNYCFTNGVVCDGVKNCGVNDWYDERKSECGLPAERLGFAPVITVVAALCCAILAAGHVLVKCLPPVAKSFFIFNANEDNRLCIDPLYVPPTNSCRINAVKQRYSVIPVYSSDESNISNEDETSIEKENDELHKLGLSGVTVSSSRVSSSENTSASKVAIKKPRRVTAIQNIQKRIRAVANYRQRVKSVVPEKNKNKKQEII